MSERRDALDALLAAGHDLRRKVEAGKTQVGLRRWLQELFRLAAEYDLARDRFESAKNLCQRCEKRHTDGSGIMCRECWIETGEPT